MIRLTKNNTQKAVERCKNLLVKVPAKAGKVKRKNNVNEIFGVNLGVN